MKRFIITLFRKLGLIKVTDKLRFFITYLLTTGSRRKFFRENPGVILPPAYFMYETFNLNYFSFYSKSLDTANWLVSALKKHVKLENIKVLDWGCGPGRVIRQLPQVMDKSCRFYGTDYNEKYIQWCANNIPEVKFNSNQLEPPTVYENDFFDIIYGISIFTHLSEKLHYEWFDELTRILKPGGILLLTLHGDAFKIKLDDAELHMYNSGKLAVKSSNKEGHRTYAAFQPTEFVAKLAGENKIIEHVPGIIKNNIPQQDIWIFQKK